MQKVRLAYAAGTIWKVMGDGLRGQLNAMLGTFGKYFGHHNDIKLTLKIAFTPAKKMPTCPPESPAVIFQTVPRV